MNFAMIESDRHRDGFPRKANVFWKQGSASQSPSRWVRKISKKLLADPSSCGAPSHFEEGPSHLRGLALPVAGP